MKKILDAIVIFCRIIVGSLFIVSGLIKVNDAVGFAYKLEEYFSERALGFPELIPYVLPIAVFIVIGEVLLGVATLLGAWPKLSSTLILAMTLFFTWLTYYTYTCDPLSVQTFVDASGQTYEASPECVNSCGCFGDALKLTPYESFLKDVFLLPFILPFFFAAWFNRVKLNSTKQDIVIVTISAVLVAAVGYKIFDWLFPAVFLAIAFGVGMLLRIRSNGKQWLMALGVLMVCIVVQYWTLVHLPIKDYRAYAIGQNIVENMKSAEELGKEPPVIWSVYTLKNEQTGETIETNSKVYLFAKLWQNKAWKIQSELTRTEKVADGYEPKITDFTALDIDGNEVRDSLFALPKVFIAVLWNVDETDKAYLKELSDFANAAQAAGIPFYGLTTSDYEKSENLRHEFQLAFPFLQGDEKVLKTMIRANPGLMYWENATVVNMWSGADIPEYSKGAAAGFKP